MYIHGIYGIYDLWIIIYGWIRDMNNFYEIIVCQGYVPMIFVQCSGKMRRENVEQSMDGSQRPLKE